MQQLCMLLQYKAIKEIEGQAARLGIVEPVKGRAVFILEREYTMLVTSGSFPIDVAAAASLYAAVRLEGQPFSLSGAAAAIGRSRHYVGTAYKVLLKALGSKLDVIDYSNYIKKHLAGLLNPLQTSAKQVQLHDNLLHLQHAFSRAYHKAPAPPMLLIVLSACLDCSLS